MQNTTIFTKEGYDACYAEYRELVDVKRREASEKIKDCIALLFTKQSSCHWRIVADTIQIDVSFCATNNLIMTLPKKNKQ